MSFSDFFNKAASWKKVFRYPDNVTPNRIVMKQSPSRTDIHASNKGDKDHSHTVINRGSLDYARTKGGNVLKDVPKSSGVCPHCGKVH